MAMRCLLVGSERGMLKKNSKIYVAGHQGMVGRAVVRRLSHLGFDNLLTRTRTELDLCDQRAVQQFFLQEKPEAVLLAAARVGGIHANNTYPANFIYENLQIECNVIHAAHMHECQHLLFLGSSCIYPKLAAQPMNEAALLTGLLESTNEPYAIAKIAGIKLCESYNRQYGRNYRSVMPTNLYGQDDNFHPENSHVIPAMMRRFHEAKTRADEAVVIWGTGRPQREFLHVDDMAAACVHVLLLNQTLYEHNTSPMVSHINVGTGVDCSIRELAETMAKVVGFEGDLKFDDSKLDGAPRKLLDVSRLERLGWKSSVPLLDGLKQTYVWFLEHIETLRRV